MRPYKQGKLDSLCGIYSIINATQKIIGKFTKDQATELFMEIIKYLDKDRSLTVFLKGASLIDIGKILRDVIYEKYEIKREMPYKKKPDTSLDNFWNYMKDFLENPENSFQKRTIILDIEGKHEHWTVVDSISDKQIKLFDSDGLKHFSRMYLTTKTPHLIGKRKTRIAPTHAYFLYL